MSPPHSEVRLLARAILHHEGTGPTVEERLDAARRVLLELVGRLGPLVGVGGFHLLLQRALKRATVEHPWLAGVETVPADPGLLGGAAESARGREPEEVAAALETIVAELIGLIARFLGADLAVRLVRQSFPEVAQGGGTGSGSEETTNE
jgi:hypothetical protein